MKRDGEFLSNRALTLVETILMVVIVAALVVALWAAISIGRERRNRAVCMGNLKQIGMAMKQYTRDMRFSFSRRTDVFPATSPKPANSNTLFQHLLIDYIELGNTGGEVGEFITDPKFCRCPSDKHLQPFNGKVLEKGQNSYSCVHGLLNDGSATTAILSDSLAPNKAPHGKAGQNVVYADGHGEWRTDAPHLKDRLDPDY